jgi:uncharacterized protein (TIGR00725 family)
VGIMGAGSPGEKSLAAAGHLGRLVAERGWIVLTGGRPVGVMAAACAGAKEVPGALTLGILPDSDSGAGPDVDLAVFTGLGDARNVINVLTSEVVVACGVEGPGTASEVALALKSGKPVILLGASDSAVSFWSTLPVAGRLFHVSDPLEAIRLMEEELRLPRLVWS